MSIIMSNSGCNATHDFANAQLILNNSSKMFIILMRKESFFLHLKRIFIAVFSSKGENLEQSEEKNILEAFKSKM